MNVGECACSTIKARSVWNQTDIRLQTGGRYRLQAAGQWKDLFIRHGPAGDPSGSAYMRLFEGRRRVPNANWFALIGAVDSDIATSFIIGKGTVQTVTTTGELTCFANDVHGFYWNNCGHVLLKVTRVA